MIAAGVGPGHEVITTPFSFVASANCILLRRRQAGLRRHRPQDAEHRRGQGRRRHHAADQGDRRRRSLRPSRRHDRAGTDSPSSTNWSLIEDACEGFGGHVATAAGERAIGSFGRAGVFGFYPNKQITTGEGGMIVTDDDTFAAACRALRNQGREGMAWLAHQRLGYNYRLSEINAALGVVQVPAARRDPRQPPPRRPPVHRAADDQPLPDPADAAGRHAHELVRLRRPPQRPVRARRPRRGHARAARRGHRLQQLLPADPPPAVHGRSSSASSPATSPSANTSPPARSRCRSSAR